MKHLKVTIVNDEGGDKGTVTVRVKDAKGKVASEDVLPEGSENEFRFEVGGDIVISAK